jgi:hypothetical protein
VRRWAATQTTAIVIPGEARRAIAGRASPNSASPHGMRLACFFVGTPAEAEMKDERDRKPSSKPSDKRDDRTDKSRRKSALPHHLRGDELEKNFDDADADSSDVTHRRIDKISES